MLYSIFQHTQGIVFAVSAALTYAVLMTRGEQIRAARALLGWTQDDLAMRAGVSTLAIKQFEAGKTSPRLITLEKMETALHEGGVVCFDGDERGGRGVRFR